LLLFSQVVEDSGRYTGNMAEFDVNYYL